MTIVLGVDLSGPTNTADTAAAWFEVGQDGLALAGHEIGVGDERLVALARELAARDPALVVGLDAPLSYQPGGGDRAADRALRKRIVAAGMPPGSVMTPTMTRMAYLTLRGVTVARALAAAVPDARIVEAHPGAALVLRGAPVADVRAIKTHPAAVTRLVGWLGAQGLTGLSDELASDHELAACACALAAWRWSRGGAVWLAPASGVHHPYDFAC